MERKSADIHEITVDPRQVGKTFGLQKQKALETVTELLTKSLDLRTPPSPDSTPADHGMDSLGFLELVFEIEDQAGREFATDPDITERSTLAEIADVIARELGQ